MARSTNEIYNQIIAEKQAKPELSSLTSESATAIYRLWAYVTAICINFLETLWDLFRVEIERIIAQAIPGTREWYAKKMREFQYGDNLQIVNNVPTYPAINPAKQIIKRVAVIDDGEGGALIKVAKLDGPAIVSLSSQELTSLRSYVNKIQFAGSKLTVSSLNTDYVKINMAIYYNPLFDLDIVKAAVEVAVNNYLANIDFNGVVVLSKITDAVQAVPGVADVVINTAESRINSGIFVPIARTYQTIAGYIQVDPDQPLSSTITYLPNLT